jgi:valyl-tRNA synthetase
VRFSEERIAQGLQLTNKLWNAARLILLGVGEDARADASPNAIEDRWILSRLERARESIGGRVDGFDFSHAALELYEFVYGELCDWYLELIKPRLRAGEPELAATLLHVLTETVTLAHPVIPFVTEEIYGYIPGPEGLLAGRVSSGAVGTLDEGAEAALARTIEAVQAVRGWRDRARLKASAILPARLAADGYAETSAHLARLARLTLSEDGGAAAASIPIAGGTVEILAGATAEILAGAEVDEERRAARRAKLEADIARAESKLANDGFVSKAPPEVVQAERDKLARLRAELEAP